MVVVDHNCRKESAAWKELRCNSRHRAHGPPQSCNGHFTGRQGEENKDKPGKRRARFKHGGWGIARANSSSTNIFGLYE
jgi:hypothetical protein